MFSAEEIRIANATSRSNGASARNKDGSIRAIVPKYVAEHIDKNDSILDYGAGKEAVHTKWPKEKGFNVVAYDFGSNSIEGVHDQNALQRKYKVVMASNVLNVSSSLGMLITTLKQIHNSLENGGIFICNYPATPRKMPWLKAKDIQDIIESTFKCDVDVVGGTPSAPLMVIKNIKKHDKMN